MVKLHHRGSSIMYHFTRYTKRSNVHLDVCRQDLIMTLKDLKDLFYFHNQCIFCSTNYCEVHKGNKWCISAAYSPDTRFPSRHHHYSISVAHHITCSTEHVQQNPKGEDISVICHVGTSSVGLVTQKQVIYYSLLVTLFQSNTVALLITSCQK